MNTRSRPGRGTRSQPEWLPRPSVQSAGPTPPAGRRTGEHHRPDLCGESPDIRLPAHHGNLAGARCTLRQEPRGPDHARKPPRAETEAKTMATSLDGQQPPAVRGRELVNQGAQTGLARLEDAPHACLTTSATAKKNHRVIDTDAAGTFSKQITYSLDKASSRGHQRSRWFERAIRCPGFPQFSQVRAHFH